MIMRKCILMAVLALVGGSTMMGQSLSERYAARLTEPRYYDCFRTTSKIKIDGKLNEGDWAKAEESAAFVDIQGALKPAPSKKTWVKMMWDDKNLYIGAKLEEDNIIGNLQQRDTIIWRNNDFEVFLDPDGDGVNYFEFENNALGTEMDLLLEKPYRSGGSFFLPWDCRGWKLAVSYDGTINKSSDTDRAWYVEMAIPFDALKRDFKDPRDFKLWRINFSRVQWLKAGGPEENWVWSPTGMVDMHMPERWGFLRFVNEAVGGKAAAFDSELDRDAYKLIWGLFYAQLDHKSQKGDFIRSVEDFHLTAADLALLPKGGIVSVEATKRAFDLMVTIPARGETYTLNQDGRFAVTKQ